MRKGGFAAVMGFAGVSDGWLNLLRVARLGAGCTGEGQTGEVLGRWRSKAGRREA